jgi:hypothetical protein
MIGRFIQFQRTWEGLPALLHGDRHLREHTDPAVRPRLLRWNVEIGEAGATELPSPTELESLARVEGPFLRSAEQDLDAVLAGVVTCDGMREYSFYCPPLANLEARAKALWKGQGWECSAEVEDDPEWQHWIQVLCPTAAEERLFEDLVQLTVLDRDPGGPPALLEHRLLFPDGEAARAFAEALRGPGLEAEAGPVVGDADGGELHPVLVRRIQRLHLAEVHGATRHLMELAESKGGAYDAWRLVEERSA